MVHIKKAVFRLVREESGEIYDKDIYARLSWLASRHAESSPSGAELIEAPMPAATAYEMMDTFDMVSGYALIEFSEILGLGETTVKEMLGKKLAEGVTIEDIEFEIVWGHSQTLLLYICGKTSG